ncbi:MAG: ATP-binding protein [Bacteroidia bacterium]
MGKYTFFFLYLCLIIFGNGNYLYAKGGLSDSLSNISDLFLQKKYETVIHASEELLLQIDTLKQHKELQQIYSLMAQSYQQMSRPKEYFDYLKRAQSQKEKVLELEKRATIEQFENDQKIKEKDKELKKLERDAITKKEQLRNQQMQIVGFIIGFLVLSGLSIGLYQSMKQKAKIQRELERKNSEIEMQNQLILQKQQDLAKMNQNKNQLFTTISKDIRMPISELKDVLKVFREQNLPPEKIVELAPQLLNNVDNVAETVDNLLKWSLREMKGDNPSLVNFDFIDVANEVLSGLDSIALHNKIKLLDTIDPKIKLYADRNQVFTILRNLLSFAIKHTPTNGSVCLEAQIKEGRAAIMVKDTAPALKEEDIVNLFNLTSNHSNPASVLAIAMTLCKTYIENYQGKLKIKSVDNQGNSYDFDLPLGS